MRVDAITLVELYVKLWRTKPDKVWCIALMSKRLNKGEGFIEERLIDLISKGVKLPGFVKG